MTRSTIFQINIVAVNLIWLRKPEDSEKTTDLPQLTDKLYHIKVVSCTYRGMGHEQDSNDPIPVPSVLNRIEYVYLSIKDAHDGQYNYMKITIFTLIGMIMIRPDFTRTTKRRKSAKSEVLNIL